ncbi:hypothetical protein N4G70_35340 [Streptomyces sp. ASQP_92]|uniref:hypothetical protein n=1 Tax=Streptomyces sp. ASQP_92 TaxID=2979116 RepID=UPI0021BEFBBD|nr:hypothetical protein [Streptomyces sp. ASQP_92]MCT9094086.1 hypothetical protein [Streptomyces sp. ASQP_92]
MRLLVAGLMSLDAAERSVTARRFMAGLPSPAGAGGSSTPRPRPSPTLLDEVITHTVATSAAAAPNLCGRPGAYHLGAPLTLYAGAAGVGLELLHHRDRPGVADAVTELARQTVPLHNCRVPTGRCTWAGPVSTCSSTQPHDTQAFPPAPRLRPLPLPTGAATRSAG